MLILQQKQLTLSQLLFGQNWSFWDYMFNKKEINSIKQEVKKLFFIVIWLSETKTWVSSNETCFFSHHDTWSEAESWNVGSTNTRNLYGQPLLKRQWYQSGTLIHCCKSLQVTGLSFGGPWLPMILRNFSEACIHRLISLPSWNRCESPRLDLFGYRLLLMSIESFYHARLYLFIYLLESLESFTTLGGLCFSRVQQKPWPSIGGWLAILTLPGNCSRTPLDALGMGLDLISGSDQPEYFLVSQR